MKIQVITILGLLSALSGSAFAEHNVYLGASCQEDAAGESGGFKRNEALIRRVSPVGSGRIICPIVRQTTGGTTTMKVEGRLSYTDVHPLENVKCAVSVRNHNGSPVSWLTQVSTGSAPGSRMMYFAKQDAGFDLPLSIECVLPPPPDPNAWPGDYYTAIHSYRAGSN